MKVVISGGGRFHIFNTAEQLEKRGVDYRLVTTYFNPKKDVIDRKKVKSFPILAYGDYLLRKLRLSDALGWNYMKNNMFDKMASRYIVKETPDIFSGCSSFSLHTIRALRKYSPDTKIALERASAHINVQSRLIADEYKKHGLKCPGISEKIIKKELMEYDESECIIVPSKFVSDTFLSEGIDKNKIVTIPLGVDIKKFRKVKKTDDVFRVVFVGNLSIQKGVHHLLEAVSGLDLDNFELVLIGKIFDDIRPFLKKYAGFYRHVGHVQHSELYKQYSNSSVFVLPSIQDGFGMVVLEAMACGLPVIISNNTGAPVMDRKDGFIVPTGNAESIRKKIEYLHESPKARDRMAKNAQKHAKLYTWDKYGERVVKQYEKMLRF